MTVEKSASGISFLRSRIRKLGMPQGVAAAVNRLTPRTRRSTTFTETKSGLGRPLREASRFLQSAIFNLEYRPSDSDFSGGIAQLVERQLCKLEVRGSNPLASKASEKRCCSGARSGAKFFGSAAAEIAASTTLNQSAARRVLSTINSSRP